MSSPLIWSVIPGMAAVLLWWLRDRTRLVRFSGMALSLFLAILTWLLPVAVTVKLGPWTFKVAETMTLLGRKLTLAPQSLPLIALLYLAAALWFLGALTIKMTSNFVPLALGMIALFVAALAVDPFLYAALLIEIAVLISIPMLASPGETVRRGVLRYLIFQTLGMPFILFTGWMLGGAQNGPPDAALVVRAAALLGLGFAFLLAVFPFYTWIPLLAEQEQPFITAFILVILPVVVLFFGLSFLAQYSWLKDIPALFPTLRSIGALMVATSGLWAAFQRHFGRIMGYALITQTGFGILALSSQGTAGSTLFAAGLLPTILAIWLWAYALSVLRRNEPDLTFSTGADWLRRYPFVSIALLLAGFTLAGLPMLAGFTFRLTVLTEIYSQSPVTAAWAFIGSLGLVMAGLRSLAALSVVRQVKNWQVNERPVESVFLVLGTLSLLILGWFPNLFANGLLAILK